MCLRPHIFLDSVTVLQMNIRNLYSGNVCYLPTFLQHADYVQPNVMMIMNDKLGNQRKETGMAYFRRLYITVAELRKITKDHS